MRSIVVALVLSILAPTTAWAQDAGEQHARELFEQGRAAYGREVYTEAEDAFVAAYEAMSPENPRRSLILLNVAQAIERQGGRDEDALVAWQRFRTEAAEVAEAEHLRRAEERIRELTARVERRRADDAAQPPPDDVVTPPPAEPSAGLTLHPAGIVVAAVGGAALIAGAIVGIYGLTERDAVLASCDGTSCPADVQGRADALATYGIAADSLIWPGLGIAAVGVVLMLVLPGDGGDESVAASCGARGCNVGWRF